MRTSNQAVNEFELDLGRYELRRRGKRVTLQKKPMELLIFLHLDENSLFRAKTS